MEFNSIGNNINAHTFSNQKADIVKNVSEEANANQPSAKPNIQNTNNLKPVNEVLIYNTQMAQMDNETLLKYLQSLLNLPNSIDKFIKELQNKNNSNLAQILTENLINSKALGEFLSQNSKEGMIKLLKVISESSKLMKNDTTQLKELLTVLNAIQINSNISSNSFKELILLYIPLNLQAFNNDPSIKDSTDEENDKTHPNYVSILIETINFSNILCKVNEENNSFYVELGINKAFPKEEFNQIINMLTKKICNSIDFEYKIKNSEKQSSLQNFKVNSNNQMSINTMLLIHIIIKTIFELDNLYQKQ